MARRPGRVVREPSLLERTELSHHDQRVAGGASGVNRLRRATLTRVGHTEGSRTDRGRVQRTMSIGLVATAYVVGGIPFAFLLARRWGGSDVRHFGSGNIGAANVLRTSGASVALVVLALDLSKGCLAVFAVRSLGADQVVQGVAASAVVAGHIFPVWLKFRGGKGVATACGAFAVLAPAASLVAAVVFVLIVWMTRYVSLGSMAAALALAPVAYVTASPFAVVVSALVVAVLVLFRHTSNVRRLYAGRERRLGEQGA